MPTTSRSTRIPESFTSETNTSSSPGSSLPRARTNTWPCKERSAAFPERSSAACGREHERGRRLGSEILPADKNRASSGIGYRRQPYPDGSGTRTCPPRPMPAKPGRFRVTAWGGAFNGRGKRVLILVTRRRSGFTARIALASCEKGRDGRQNGQPPHASVEVARPTGRPSVRQNFCPTFAHLR